MIPLLCERIGFRNLPEKEVSDHDVTSKYLKYLVLPSPVDLPAVRVRRIEGPVELRPHQRSRADELSSRHEEVVAVGVEGGRRFVSVEDILGTTIFVLI